MTRSRPTCSPGLPAVGNPEAVLKRRFLTILAAFLPLTAQGQTVKVDFDQGTDFSRYKTFAWSPTQRPAPNAANHVRIVRAVEVELQARGLTRAEAGEADLLVAYQGKVGQKLRGQRSSAETGWQPADLRTTIDLKLVKEGTLIVELFDQVSRQRVWRSIASDTPASPDMIEEQIRTFVKKSFGDFPPKPLGQGR